MHPQTTARIGFNCFRLLPAPRPVGFGNSDTGWWSRWAACLGFALLCLVTSVTALGQADNDLFANRAPLTGTELGFLAVTQDATIEPGEPNHAGPDSQSTASVWWNWTAPADGGLVLRREEGSNPGALAVYRGQSLGQLALVGTSRGEFTEFLPVTAGTSYAIAVSEATNPFQFLANFQTIYLKFFPAAANDQFAGRQRLEGEVVSFEAQRIGMTREPGEPVHGTEAGEHTAWFTWQAPASGEVAVTLLPSDIASQSSDGVMAAYEGTQLASLKRVTNEGPASSTPLLFHAEAGHTYQLAAGDFQQDVSLWDHPQRHFRLVLSRARITSPPDGLTLPNPVALKLDVTGLPTDADPLQFGLQGADIFGGPELIGPPPWELPPLAPGRHELRLLIYGEGGRQYFTPSVVVTVGLTNDNFANRLTLSGEHLEVPVDPRNATYENGEPFDYGTHQPNSVWWSWTAPADGVLACPIYTPWEAFSGDTLATLTPETIFRRDFYLDEDRLPVLAGKTYQLRFQSYNQDQGGDIPPSWSSTTARPMTAPKTRPNSPAMRRTYRSAPCTRKYRPTNDSRCPPPNLIRPASGMPGPPRPAAGSGSAAILPP